MTRWLWAAHAAGSHDLDEGALLTSAPDRHIGSFCLDRTFLVADVND
jgi:hypothetical protein